MWAWSIHNTHRFAKRNIQIKNEIHDADRFRNRRSLGYGNQNENKTELSIMKNENTRLHRVQQQIWHN